MADPLAEVKALEAADRLEDAARLAERLQRHDEAARLFERACDFERAAEAALRAGDARHAFRLAARADARQLELRATEALREQPELGRVAAGDVATAGQREAAARLYLALGDAPAAAAEFEAAGAFELAADAFAQAKAPREAARCLELALARDPSAHRARVGLGRLLASHGKHQAAIRAVQAVPPSAPERAEALGIALASLHALGLTEAAAQTRAELDALGADAATPMAPTSAGGDTEAVLFGRYQVVRDVARTPTARVLEAIDRISGGRVAVKIFAAAAARDAGRDALHRFAREAEILGKLRHPSILPLAAFLPDVPAVILPWMAGGSLADQLARAPLSPARAAEITIAVLSALGEAHRRGMLHRDIKPANVLFDEAGAAYLADFGTAHVSDAGHTVTSGVIGTLAYMAPEQRRGAPANISSDIYGAGALFWHALTGAPPGGGLPFLSDELGPEHRAIAARLIAEEATRPAETRVAIELLRSVDWPRAAPAARPTSPTAEADAPRNDRLVALGGARFRDTLLDRVLLVLAAQGGVKERALAFARADHPVLAAVLRAEVDDERLWIEDVDGPALDRALTADEARDLAEALSALHRAGGWHGAVDADHVCIRGGRVWLRFPTAPESDDPHADERGLARLAGATAP